MVKWTLPAKSDLKNIHDFIANDSKFYAKKEAHEIHEKTNILNSHPQIGRIIPEIEDPNLRELHIYSYRIMYEIKNDTCIVLAVIHARQDFSVDHLP